MLHSPEGRNPKTVGFKSTPIPRGNYEKKTHEETVKRHFEALLIKMPLFWEITRLAGYDSRPRKHTFLKT